MTYSVSFVTQRMDVFAGTSLQNAIFTCIILRKRLHNDILDCLAVKNSTDHSNLQHFPLHDKKYFGKCDFCDRWEEAWKGRAEVSE